MPKSIAGCVALVTVILLPAIAVAQQGPPVIKEESPGLKAKATLSADSAVAIATRSAPKGAKISSAELEMEHGRLIYSFDFKTPGQRGIHEVEIDAKTGAVIGSAPESEADEKKEADEDREADDSTRR